jgi:hypothetical protein
VNRRDERKQCASEGPSISVAAQSRGNWGDLCEGSLHLFTYVWFIRSRDSAVGIATGYGLGDGGVGVRVPVGSRIVFSLRRPASCPMDTGGSLPGGKAAGA